MPLPVPKWRETKIYRYIKKEKLVSLIQNKGKKMDLELKEDDMNIRFSQDICFVNIPSDWKDFTDEEITDAMDEDSST